MKLAEILSTDRGIKNAVCRYDAIAFKERNNILVTIAKLIELEYIKFCEKKSESKYHICSLIRKLKIKKVDLHIE